MSGTLECDLKNVNEAVFKKGRKLKKNGSWFIQVQEMEIVNGISHTSVTLESTGE